MLFGKKPEVLGENSNPERKVGSDLNQAPLPPSPSPISTLSGLFPRTRRKASKTQWAIALASIAAIFTLTIPVSTYHPFHGWECGLYLFLPCAIIPLLAYLPLYRCMVARSPGEPTVARTLMFLLCLTLGIEGIVFYVNGHCDTSTPETTSFTIVAKDWTSGKNGRHYYAYIVNPEPSPLPFSFSQYQSMGIGSQSYNTIVTGTSRATITIHSGYFGFPWFDHLKLSGLVGH